MAKKTADNSSGLLFEEDYLVRTLGRLAHDPQTALTELVANSSDAGASEVEIVIPEAKGNTLTVLDNGHGMTAHQFKTRWMTMGYNRIKHQGVDVEFPPSRQNWHRQAYGRNGIGRHSLLCFADQYLVETWRDGNGSIFGIGTHSQSTPFRIESEQSLPKSGHGTKLSVTVDRHLPDPEKIREIISARFLHDPQFIVKVNGESIQLPEHSGLIEKTTLEIGPQIKVEAFVIDSTKAAASTLYQGIAFWVSNRLVGTPSWTLGNRVVIDGRSRFAKRYSVVIKSNDLLSEIEPDWRSFKDTPTIQKLFDVTAKYVQHVIEKLSAALIQESSEDALLRNKEQFKELSKLARAEVAAFAQEVVTSSPAINSDSLAIAVQAVINLEKSRNGTALLKKLTLLDDEDIAGLDKLLSEWSVRDALNVLDEIDNRLTVISAIEKLSVESTTDELHTLHPLVTQARWLFGPEYDSPEYSSNSSLINAIRDVFKQETSRADFENWRKRPDLVIRANSTFSVVGMDDFDSPNSNLTRMRDILIIELKKGDSEIGRDELSQATSYVEDFLGCNLIDGAPYIHAYVVGHRIGRVERVRTVGDVVQRARIEAVTYGQLVRTANQRLFKLRDRIPARYEDMSGASLAAKVLETRNQGSLLEDSPKRS